MRIIDKQEAHRARQKAMGEWIETVYDSSLDDVWTDVLTDERLVARWWSPR